MSATMTPTPTPRLALTVGPVLYHWPRDTLTQFYADIADGPADTVVLGETVCARRRELRLDDWLALGRELRAAGKQVVLAAQALIETEADLRLLERQAGQPDFAVEAGDASALQLLAGRVPLVLGPHLNIYSRAALQEHADLGADRWVAPVELSLDQLAAVNPAQDPVNAHRQFDQRWNDWVAQREAIAMPGAVAFLKQADADGVTVFYITNRKDPEKRETCNNLTQVGLPLKD